MSCDTTISESGLVEKANNLLEHVQINYRVQYLGDITPSVFVIVYERLLSQTLKDVIREPRGREDEIHNVQVVIDSLSMDVLDVSLSHITGDDIVRLNRRSLDNLLEVLNGLGIYILGAIDSDISFDSEDNYGDLYPARCMNGTTETGNRVKDSLRVYPDGDVSQPYGRALPVWEDTHDEDSTQYLIRNARLIEQRLLNGTDLLTKSLPSSTNKLHHSHVREAQPDSKESQTLIKDEIWEREPQSPQEKNHIGDEKSTSLITPDLPNKNDAQFDYIGATSRVSNTRTDEQTNKHTSLHLNGKDVGSKNAGLTIQAAKAASTRMKSSSAASVHPKTNVAVRSTVPKSCSTVSSDQNTHSADKIDLSHCSPGIRETIRSLDDQTSMIDVISKSPPKYIPPHRKIKQQNVFDRLYENPIAAAVSRDSNTSDKRIVQFRDKNANNQSHLTQSNVQTTQHSEDKKKPLSHTLHRSFISRHTRHYSSDSEVDTSFVRMRRETRSNEPKETKVQARTSVPERYRHATDVLTDLVEKYRPAKVTDSNISMGDKKRVQFESPEPADQTSVYAKSSYDAEKKFKRCVKYLSRVYDKDLEDIRDELHEDLDIDYKTAEKIDEEFKRKFLGSKKNKSSNNIGTKKPTPGLVKPRKERKRSRSASPSVGSGRRSTVTSIEDQDDLVTGLLEEFPYLYISGETWHELWRKGIAQIKQITRKNQDTRRQKSRSQSLMEAADRKQDLLHNIMRKQLAHTHRLRETKAQRVNDISLRNRLRDKRVEIARARRYYEEYQMRMRAKMLKKRTREEQVFKKLFKDGLDIQKERVQDIQNYAKEQKEKRNQKQKNELMSIENFYRDQFELLAASVAQERQDLLIREKAQQQVLDQMKRQLRNKMEGDIRDIQDQLFRDDDDVYFRQLDADRIRDTIKSTAFNM